MLIKMNMIVEKKIMGIKINHSICIHILTIANKYERLALLIKGLTLGIQNESPSINTK